MLGQLVTVTVDRPLGSRHPTWGFLYPVNYGFIAGVLGGDGDDQDAYILGVDVPVETFTGRCIGIIEREDDVETKLVVVPDGLVLSADEVMAAVAFQEAYFRSRFRS